jgi:hypothetical protein
MAACAHARRRLGAVGLLCAGLKHVLLGTKAGELLIYELATQRLLQTVKAHDGPMWSIMLVPGSPDAFATGGGDQEAEHVAARAGADGEGGAAELSARVDARSS